MLGCNEYNLVAKDYKATDVWLLSAFNRYLFIMGGAGRQKQVMDCFVIGILF